MPESSPPSTAELLRARILIAKSAGANKGTKKKTSKLIVNENEDPSQPERKRRNWTKQENWHLTESLLTLIEDSPTWKIALSFNKGDAGSVSSGGKKLADHYRTIAKRLFIDPVGSTWDESDLVQLKDVTKNRINSLKSSYIAHRKELGETGQGLVDKDREDEIIPGTPINNAWQLICAKFPFYKCMHALMGSNPTVNKSAVVHSSTPLNLGILDRDGSSKLSNLQTLLVMDSDDGEMLADVMGGSSPMPDSHRGSPSLDTVDEDEKEPISSHQRSASQGSIETIKSEPGESSGASFSRLWSGSKSESSSMQGHKRKSMQESLEEITAAERETRAKIALEKAKEKTSHAAAREKIKHQGLLAIENA